MKTCLAFALLLLLCGLCLPAQAASNWVEVVLDPGWYQIEFPNDPMRLPSGAFRLTAAMQFPGGALDVSAWVGFYNPPRENVGDPVPPIQPGWGVWDYAAMPFQRRPHTLRAEQDLISGMVTRYVDGAKVGQVPGPRTLQPQGFAMRIGHGPGNALVGDTSPAGPPSPSIHYCYMHQTVQSVSIGWIGKDGLQKMKSEAFGPGVESRWNCSDFAAHMDRVHIGNGLTIETTAFGTAPADTGHARADEWERPDLYPKGIGVSLGTTTD